MKDRIMCCGHRMSKPVLDLGCGMSEHYVSLLHVVLGGGECWWWCIAYPVVIS